VRDREKHYYNFKRRLLQMNVKEIINNRPGKKILSPETKQELWEKALNEFPDDRMMQEYFYLRLMQKYMGQEVKGREEL
jgi:hypothetical protein